MARAEIGFQRFLREQLRGTHPNRSLRLQHCYKWITEEMRNLKELVDLETLMRRTDSHLSFLRRASVHGFSRRLLGDRSTVKLIGGADLSPAELLSDLRLAILEYIHHEFGRQLDAVSREAAANAFTSLAGVLKGTPFALFTTNYDPVADAVPAMLGLRSLDGFHRETPDGPEKWSPERFAHADDESCLPLIHLHGSASWFMVRGEITRHPGIGALIPGAESLLVYPGQAKDPITEKVPAPSQLGYEYLTRLVTERRVLVALGYSFRDESLVWLLQTAAKAGDGAIHLISVGPTPVQPFDALVGPTDVEIEHVAGHFEQPGQWTQKLRTALDRTFSRRPAS